MREVVEQRPEDGQAGGGKVAAFLTAHTLR